MVDYSLYRRWLASQAVRALGNIIRDPKCSPDIRIAAFRKLMSLAYD